MFPHCKTSLKAHIGHNLSRGNEHSEQVQSGFEEILGLSQGATWLEEDSLSFKMFTSETRYFYHPQRTITTFFSPVTPTNATSQSRATQMGSRPGHNKGVTIDRAIAMWHARKPQPFEINPITLVIYK